MEELKAQPAKIVIKHRYSDAVLFEYQPTEEQQGSAIRHLLDACRVTAGGCIEWTLSLTSGSGRLTRNGRQEYAHRVMYETIHGPIPNGLLVRHQCDNRACINPNHLILGTHADNMHDMVQRGRSTKGRPLSAEHRRKVSESRRGRKHPEHVKLAIAASVRRHRASITEAEAA